MAIDPILLDPPDEVPLRDLGPDLNLSHESSSSELEFDARPSTSHQDPRPSTSHQNPRPSTSHQDWRPWTSHQDPRPSTSQQDPIDLTALEVLPESPITASEVLPESPIHLTGSEMLPKSPIPLTALEVLPESPLQERHQPTVHSTLFYVDPVSGDQYFFDHTNTPSSSSGVQTAVDPFDLEMYVRLLGCLNQLHERYKESFEAKQVLSGYLQNFLNNV